MTFVNKFRGTPGADFLRQQLRAQIRELEAGLIKKNSDDIIRTETWCELADAINTDKSGLLDGLEDHIIEYCHRVAEQNNAEINTMLLVLRSALNALDKSVTSEGQVLGNAKPVFIQVKTKGGRSNGI